MSPLSNPSVSCLMASGWSPVGLYFDVSLNSISAKLQKTSAQIAKNRFLYFVNKRNMCIFAVQKQEQNNEEAIAHHFYGRFAAF
jgi:hypothetical protein